MRLFSDVASSIEDPFLRHAAALAARAAGRTAPNPLVGCVVVRDGRIVGEGFHPRAGEPHAEVFALADAAELASGSDLYVTLEPCRHHGRTPPCTDAIIAAGIKRVVIGMRDPSGDAGGGAAVLQAAGIEVSFAENPEPFAELNAGWLTRIASGTPRVRAKAALTLDGRIAFEPGVRSAITGTAGAAVTRRLRGATDAVLVGAATVAADDPALTVRDSHGLVAEHQPLRVVLSRTGAHLADAAVFSDGKAPTLLLVPESAAQAARAWLPDSVLVDAIPDGEGLAGALRLLGARGINDVLVEPGRRLFSALWESGLIDELVTVTAGGMAGVDGLALFEGDPDRVKDVLTHRMRPVEAGVVGDVSVTVWQPDDTVSFAGLPGR